MPVSLERLALAPPAAKPYDGYLNVLRKPAPGPVTDYDVHYTASSTVAPDAPVGVDPATGWVAVAGTPGPAATLIVEPVRGLTNGTVYRVRVRAAGRSAPRWSSGFAMTGAMRRPGRASSSGPVSASG